MFCSLRVKEELSVCGISGCYIVFCPNEWPELGCSEQATQRAILVLNSLLLDFFYWERKKVGGGNLCSQDFMTLSTHLKYSQLTGVLGLLG